MNSRKQIVKKVVGKKSKKLSGRARDLEIMRLARERVRGQRTVNRFVRGIACKRCGSRKTQTEFYKSASDRAPRFGVTACDSCGAS